MLDYSAAQRWRNNEQVLVQTLGSFGRLSDPKILAVQPRRLRVVQLEKELSLQEFANRYSSEVPLQSLALINQVGPRGQFVAGALAKSVVPEVGEAQQQVPGEFRARDTQRPQQQRPVGRKPRIGDAFAQN